MTTAREFTSRLVDLLRHEQSAMADFLIALADFDRKRLWVELGHSSLYYFLHRELGLSAGAAHYRKTATELIQRFPEVVEPLRDGRLCITSIVEVARVMTPENRAEILHRFFHASKQQAKAIAAEISPREAAPHRALVTAVGPVSCARPAIGAARASGSPPTAPPEAFALSQSFRPGETPLTQASVAKARPAVSAPAPAPRSTTEPLTANLRRLHVTVSKRFLAKLDAARDALSHSHPGVDVETILEVGLELVIERHAKRKGLVAKPRAMPPPHLDPLPSGGGGDDESPCRLPVQGEASRYIPAHVKREVWIRDQGCCQWKLAGGGICGSTVRLQFDHILPVARGGTSTVSNTRILCAIHNRIAARRVFGDALMDRFVPKRPSAALLDSR